MMPVISAIMSVYNNENTVEEAMNSILGQTFQDWECIICDDASDDGTWHKINGIARGNARFIVMRNDKNRGPAFTRNRCIEKARGRYIVIQDADDISAPDRFDVLSGVLEGNEQIGAAGSYARLVDKDGGTWGKLTAATNPETGAWLSGCQVIHASVMFRKKDLLESGLYDETLRTAEDYDLFSRLIVRGLKVVSVPRFLYSVRWDASSYRRKNLAARWQEARVKLRIARMTAAKWYSYLYVVKPLVLGFIPPVLLYAYHRRVFSKSNR